MRFGFTTFATIGLSVLMLSGVAFAAPNSLNELPPPPSKQELQAIRKEKQDAGEEGKSALPIDIRNDAMKESALSYGARGGLNWRTYYIRQEMESRARYMDKVFDFHQLLIAAPSGLLIEPPVIGESADAMIIDQGGLEAAVADRVYNIGRNARIVSAARTWRMYLERQWGEVSPPPDILLPVNKEEQKKWDAWFDKGWEAGVAQADEIFQADLNKLSSDYQGMVRYRTLLAQGMVSPPYALQVDRGVTGGGNEMRVGDRNVSITGLPSLQTGTQEWLPANR
ncbi:MAG: type IV secretion system protein DotC [Micavibrio aeruginosavorus]|uniref:Type IV secretion system protein DotC n=1 Tax=Micavibrio aeruginosavorus TaxID=349221 RepID=A0A2W5QCG5_9BACT|nr:MAG: type IV secretion system protein DotC [Micavibrio aeruginosavorus]